jgi:tetratricopeptide (TPR) repeat protein
MMSKSFGRIVAALFIVVSILAARVARADDNKPVRAEEVLALIAGNAMPEDIIHVITQNGLAFAPDDSYRAQLKAIGANDSIVAAVNGAKVATGDKAEAMPEKALLQHYVDAAIKMKAKDYSGADSELTATVKGSFQEVEAGFVAGEMLRLENHDAAALATYIAVLKLDPAFPGAHSKVAFIYYRLNMGEDAVREANAALALFSDDAEAHKNAALGLYLLDEYDASESEYNKALKLKPGYIAVISDRAMLYDAQGKYKLAIDADKRSIAADPTDAVVYAHLGLAYEHNGQLDQAIAAYRKSLELDPKSGFALNNLGHALQESGMNKEAVSEFRNLEELYPNDSMCHTCMGNALYRTWDFDGAEKEFKLAVQLDPTEFEPHLGLGDLREEQKRYDEALAEFQIATQLSPSAVDPLRGAGRVYITKKDFVHAAAALKKAEENAPADANVHDLYGQALLGEGKRGDAIGEFKQSLLLNSKQDQVALRLAAALEADGNWVQAIDEYRKTAAAFASLDRRHLTRYTDDLDPQAEYAAAQKRLSDHIAALKAAGKTSEAASLEASIHTSVNSAGLSDKLNSLMQAGMQASAQRNFDEARKDYQEAVDVAERLQPHDQRLVTALDHLGNQNMGMNFPAADAAFQQELKATEEIYGAQSANMEGPLQSLGTSALLQKDYASAEKYYFRAVDVDTKAYGESSDRVASSLIIATRVYMVQKQYDKAEPYLLRAERLDESIYGADSPNNMKSLWALCNMYDNWGKADKAEPCYAHAVTIGEKEFGANNPQIIPVLAADSAQLHKLGKNQDADKLDARAAALRSATMQR